MAEASIDCYSRPYQILSPSTGQEHVLTVKAVALGLKCQVVKIELKGDISGPSWQVEFHGCIILHFCHLCYRQYMIMVWIHG